MERESSGTPPSSPKLKLAGDDGPLRRASYSPADHSVGRSSSFNNKQSSPGAIVKPGVKADASSVVRPPPSKAAATFFAQHLSQQLTSSEPTLSGLTGRSKSPRKPSLQESEEENT
uniref:Uncharacterized protein n=1 Tax=Romanomermis culicivorax TaxID=13658 RepID=A0A915HUI3_ROMCU